MPNHLEDVWKKWSHLKNLTTASRNVTDFLQAVNACANEPAISKCHSTPTIAIQVGVSRPLMRIGLPRQTMPSQILLVVIDLLHNLALVFTKSVASKVTLLRNVPQFILYQSGHPILQADHCSNHQHHGCLELILLQILLPSLHNGFSTVVLLTMSLLTWAIDHFMHHTPTLTTSWSEMPWVSKSLTLLPPLLLLLNLPLH